MCTLEKRGRVFVLTLTGPGEHRLSQTLIDSLRSALSHVRSASPSSSALVTTSSSNSRFFSNGFDLPWARSTPTSASATARLRLMGTAFTPLIADLLSLPMPTIAAVTGHAAAAGFLLALCHDHILMRSDRGFLYMTELDIGLPLPESFMGVLRSKIGSPRARVEVLLRARKVKAAEAVEMGIVEEAHEGAEATSEAAVRLGEELAGKGWDGEVYASIRKCSFPEACVAVGVSMEVEPRMIQPKL
ncbi:hypothetical protein QJS10_CPA01g01806 [Acorus calamus]|uniref:Delta(3)-Delta(2)-enoyl-CoA isomerase n=1 Tax=Acorus calamus TaxID=4465 RepID=A0AAV9FP37_ACOCL|nr:hypothetical protein QJS10_CPA01g01806 [Acorus calamus]